MKIEYQYVFYVNQDKKPQLLGMPVENLTSKILDHFSMKVHSSYHLL